MLLEVSPMFLYHRAEGTRVKNLSPLREMMPYLFPRRNDAVVYFEQEIDVEQALKYLEGKDLTFFHLVITGIVRALHLRPGLNRFVSGGKIYQRKNITVSFAVKKEKKDEGRITPVKIECNGEETLSTMAQKINAVIGQGRGKKDTTSEAELNLMRFLPGFLIRILLWFYRWLDGIGLLPYAMVKKDPLYCSIFLANIGSLGLHAPWHHLYEMGTSPFFGVIGKIKKVPVVNEQNQVVPRQMVLIRYSFDERINDAFYCAASLKLLEDYLANPTLLELPPTQTV